MYILKDILGRKILEIIYEMQREMLIKKLSDM